MTAGIPLSMLARQMLILGSGFSTRYQNSWLVWEPGARVTPSPRDPRELVMTVVPVFSNERAPTYEDPLCFPLLPKPNGPLTVGRSMQSDLIIDDLTVSRTHFELSNEGTEWFIAVSAHSSATTLVRNNSLQPGERMKLVDGCAIVAGGVTFTFASRGKLFPRVMEAAERLPKRVM